MMYKTPTFAEPQQYNRPFSTGQISAFIIQLVIWHVLPTGARCEREHRDDLDFLQMNGYVPCGIYSI
jgi:hypothetical protein